jgi:alpha-L-arabinofuranosidase
MTSNLSLLYCWRVSLISEKHFLKINFYRVHLGCRKVGAILLKVCRHTRNISFCNIAQFLNSFEAVLREY